MANNTFLESINTYIQIQQQLKQLLGKEVDLVEEGTLMPFAVESANRDKKLIYET